LEKKTGGKNKRMEGWGEWQSGAELYVSGKKKQPEKKGAYKRGEKDCQRSGLKGKKNTVRTAGMVQGGRIKQAKSKGLS